MTRTMGSMGGRPLKGGQRRRVVATKVPLQFHDQLIAEAERRGVPLCDLGALLMLRGLNAERTSGGLPEVPIPDYLAPAALPAGRPVVLQEPLLAS